MKKLLIPLLLLLIVAFIAPSAATSTDNLDDIVDSINRGDIDVEITDEAGDTILHLAAGHGKKDLVQLLLRKNANIEARNRGGRTPLHNAAYFGHVECVEALLEAGANISAIDTDGTTPLHYAAFEGHAEVVELLANSNADLSATDRGGATAMHGAAFNGHAKVVRLLIRSNANLVGRKVKTEKTALHLAAWQGHPSSLAVLLEALNSLPADQKSQIINAKDEEGLTAVAYAANNGHYVCKGQLLSAGADSNIGDKKIPVRRRGRLTKEQKPRVESHKSPEQLIAEQEKADAIAAELIAEEQALKGKYPQVIQKGKKAKEKRGHKGKSSTEGQGGPSSRSLTIEPDDEERTYEINSQPPIADFSGMALTTTKKQLSENLALIIDPDQPSGSGSSPAEIPPDVNEAQPFAANDAEIGGNNNELLGRILRECSVCLEPRTNLQLVVPCGHRCVCEKCADLLSKCPVCNKKIAMIIPVYECCPIVPE